ncbi:MAG: 5'/3'-nucleotidase SurE [Bacteroidetes bacterium]|jgi:5'-nucleotidase|nr:5'/3'-nucleotidase SurE [Bacteroidota bacterium]
MSKRPLILITNDDGIASPGLAATAAALDPLGELLIVAPSNQQTSMSRSRSQNKELDGKLSEYTVVFQKQSWPGIAANATPALSVEHAIQEISERPIDLVVSGINYGVNIGTCVTVSGTIGAALEAAENKIPALAISQELDRAEYHKYSVVDFSAAIHFTQLFSKKVLECSLPFDVDLLKIEIPLNASPQTEWVVTKQDRLVYYQPYFDPELERFHTPHRIRHRPQKGKYLEKGTDAYALAQGLVSVTPLSLDLSSRTELSKLFELLK